MPLQHITPSMLKIMKRGKGVEQLNELMNHMKSKTKLFVRTTFIAGTSLVKTAEDFKALCKL